VAPGHLCSNLLHKCEVRPRRCEGTHVLEIPGGVPRHPREGVQQVLREPLDDLCAPTLLLLTLENLGADGAVQKNEFFVCCDRSPGLSLADACLQALKPGRVLGCREEVRDVRLSQGYLRSKGPSSFQ
jgi:hypothetical protein